jgi:hypothetical protein
VLRSLAAELQELKPKLPPDLRGGPDGYDLDDVEYAAGSAHASASFWSLLPC